MITLDALRIRPEGRPQPETLTLHLTRGIHGLVSADGALATALLERLYGLSPSEGGSATCDGHPLRRRDIAFAEQRPRLLDGLTGRDWLGIVCGLRPACREPLEYLTERLGLPLACRTERWSLGERKALAVAVALSLDKRIVLLDEPFEGIPEGARRPIEARILERGMRGATVLIASRQTSPLETLCEDLYLLAPGQGARRYPRPEFAAAARHPARPAEVVEPKTR